MIATSVAPLLTFEHPTEYVDRNLPTASWWDRYTLLPGDYRFSWVNINYSAWTPASNAAQPYYAQVTIDALLIEQYRVSRLFSASSSMHTVFHEPERTTVTKSIYAYQLRGRPMTGFLGGVVTAG